MDMTKKKTITVRKVRAGRAAPAKEPCQDAVPEGADLRKEAPDERKVLSDGRAYHKLSGARGDRPKDIGKFVRALFEHHKFSAIEDLVLLAMDPPEDMKTSDRIAVLKHLSEYEAPKAKSESLVGQQSASSGIQIQVVQFGSQAQVRERVPEEQYKEFMNRGTGDSE